MERHNFVNIQKLGREEILYLIDMAKEFEAHPNRELLKGRVIATPVSYTHLTLPTN